MDRPEPVSISQKSPRATAGPRDSISIPTTSVTSPVHCTGSAFWTHARYGVRSMPLLKALASETVCKSTLDLLQLGINRRVEIAAFRLQHQAAHRQRRV